MTPPTRNASKLALGIDLGGTKIEAALVEVIPGGDLAIAMRQRVPTPRDEGYEAILSATAELAREVARKERLDLDEVPIGVGMPGSVDRHGRIKNSNTTCLNGRPFRSELPGRLGVEIQFDNDANCFALAETVAGAARPFSEGLVLGLILGTGVGAGLVHHRRVWSGRHGIAGEWGHHAVVWPSGRPCYCGSSGCVETYLSGPAAEAEYERRSGTALGLREIA
jgi:fructokinase